MQKLFLATAFAAIFAAGCKDHASASDDVTLIPLKTFKKDSSDLKPGTPVRILAFSGGKIGHGDSSYYSEFIVLNPATGDTIRILTALISIDDASAGSLKAIYSPPGSFDGNARIFDATFEAPSANEDLFLNVVANQPGEGEKPTTTHARPAHEFVVVDNNPDFFARPYKTTIGVLHFDRRPW